MCQPRHTEACALLSALLLLVRRQASHAPAPSTFLDVPLYFSDGRVVQLTGVAANASASDFRAFVRGKTALGSRDAFVLAFGGAVLNGERSLAQFGVRSGDAVVVVKLGDFDANVSLLRSLQPRFNRESCVYTSVEKRLVARPPSKLASVSEWRPSDHVIIGQGQDFKLELQGLRQLAATVSVVPSTPLCSHLQ